MPEADDAVPFPLRPVVGALLESQPVPAFFVSDPALPVIANATARRLLSETPLGPRVLADDGTDLWTIIAGRADEGEPPLNFNLRVRDGNGDLLQTALSVVPMRGPRGTLSSAIVFVLNIPAERLGDAGVPHEESADELEALVARLGPQISADQVHLVEFDRDSDFTGKIRAFWSASGESCPLREISLAAAPCGAFQGKRVLTVPSGLGKAYPALPLLSAFESYVGVALLGRDGEQIGVLTALWREPLKDGPGMAAVLTIASLEAARELREEIARRELLESEQRYGSVFEGSAVPILLVEPGTTQIVDANSAAVTFYGYSRDDFFSMSILQLDLLPAEVTQAEIGRITEGQRNRFVGQHLLASGRIRDVEVNMGPITVSGRRLLYAMINDITERKSMEAEIERSRHSLERTVAQRTEDLLRANSELQHASMARDMVFVNLAQELRTSLQTITGFSALLLDGMAGDLTPEQHRQVEMIHQAGKRLATFAATLVETQRAEQVPAVELEQFDLVTFAESVIFGLASFAEDKGLALVLAADERPVPVTTDRYKLQQILLNLLSNAIRYTERGSVTVRVGRTAQGESVVAIADTGVGIADERLETLFEGPEVHEGPAGIGLPASQRTAALLGGSIHAQSMVGRGTVFTLRLPTAVASEKEVDSDG